MPITKLDELRAINKLEFTVRELQEILPGIIMALASESSNKRLAASHAISRLVQTGSKFTVSLADSAHRVEEDTRNPHSLAESYEALAKDLEETIQQAAKSKKDPHILPAVFNLVQASISILWAIGCAKSRLIGEIAKSCFSKSGWDDLHEARLRAIELDREGRHYAK